MSHTASDFTPPSLRALAARSPRLDPALVPDLGALDLDDPTSVINVYNGQPWLCVARTPAGALVLGYRCDEDEDEDGAAYLLTPTSPEVVTALEANALPLRDAVEAPWMALVWVTWAGEVQSACVVQPGDVPNGHLPVRGVRLRLRP